MLQQWQRSPHAQYTGHQQVEAPWDLSSIKIIVCFLQVRLLMCYVITHPEKMDDAKQQQWQRLSHLTDMDMNSINNLELLGVPVKKRGTSKGIGLTFGRKRKRAVRKASFTILVKSCTCLTSLLSTAHAPRPLFLRLCFWVSGYRLGFQISISGLYSSFMLGTHLRV